MTLDRAEVGSRLGGWPELVSRVAMDQCVMDTAGCVPGASGAVHESP